MDQADTLALIAQLAISLVGFAGLVGVFIRPREGSWTLGAKFRLRLLIEGGLIVTFVALIPLAMYEFQVPEADLWRWACAIYLLIHLTTFIGTARNHVRLRHDHAEEISKAAGMIQWSISGSISILTLLGTLNFWPGVNSGFFILALSSQLAMPAISFFMMIISTTKETSSAG